MTIEQIKSENILLLESVSGSQAYGTATIHSDTDIKGVYLLNEQLYYSLDQEWQVNADNNNIVFYELKKFIELLAKNNPNMLELLAVPEDCIIYKHPLFDLIQPGLFISKLCKESFAGYAMSQIKKARGLNKKILNPMEDRRKSILEFCHVIHGQGSIPLANFLNQNQLKQENCGLVAIPHMRDTYGLYYSNEGIYSGIIKDENSMDVSLSSVKAQAVPVAFLSFNKDGFSKYCKDYKQYHEWRELRNEERFTNTMEHGKNYDAKNMMHTFRLLEMAEEIGKTGKIIVRRPDRDKLLQIKSGHFTYEELLQMAEDKLESINEIYAHSDLPEQPDMTKINNLLVDLRMKFYHSR